MTSERLLSEVMESFAKTERYCLDPTLAENMCGSVSYALTLRLLHWGFDVKWINCSHAINPTRTSHGLCGHHVAVVVGTTVIDFTSRQYWPEDPWPVVEPLAQYRRRFAVTSVVASPMYCNGPSREARRDRARREREAARSA